MLIRDIHIETMVRGGGQCKGGCHVTIGKERHVVIYSEGYRGHLARNRYHLDCFMPVAARQAKALDDVLKRLVLDSIVDSKGATYTFA